MATNYAELQRLADANTSINFVKTVRGNTQFDNGDFTIENPVYMYRSNFGGAEVRNQNGKIVNAKGKRNFTVVIPTQMVPIFRDKWEYLIRTKYNQDENKMDIIEDGPCYYLKVNVKYVDKRFSETRAKYNSVIHRLSENNGVKTAVELGFYDDETKGVGMLDNDENGKKVGGTMLITRYYHPDGPYMITDEVATAQLKSAMIIVENAFDPMSQYADYFHSNRNEDYTPNYEEDPGDEECPF